MMKLTTKLPNGRLKVNKAAVIERLMKLRKERKGVEIPGLLPVSEREVAAEARELNRYNADNFINNSEE
jgi:hypothetical protein